MTASKSLRLGFSLQKAHERNVAFTLNPVVGVIKNEGFSAEKIKRNFYPEFLLEVGRKEKIIAGLIEEECRYLGIAPLATSLTTICCNKIRVSPANAALILERLQAAFPLFYQSTRIRYDSGQRIRLDYAIKDCSKNFAEIEGVVYRSGCRCLAKDLTAVFISDTAFCLLHESLYQLDAAIHPRWLRKIYPDPWKITGRAWDDFQEDFLPLPPVDAPKVEWNKLSAKDMEPKVSISPILELVDPWGSCANLKFDYPSMGIVVFSSRETTIGSYTRHTKEEVQWEKDLLEVGYQKKQIGSARYFCSPQQAREVLKFLLELGWIVIDHRKRRVVLPTSNVCKVGHRDNQWLFEGKVSYGSFDVSYPAIADLNARNEFLAPLEKNTVGFIDLKLPSEGIVINDFEMRVPVHEIAQCKEMIDKAAVNWENENTQNRFQRFLDPTKIENQQPDRQFHGTLRPYQLEGMNWLSFLYNEGLGGILADEMGLGKTVQVLAFCSLIRSQYPILIVVPASLVFQWKREISKFIPQYTLIIHSGENRNKTLPIASNCIILTSYSILRIDHDHCFAKHQFSCIFLDEAQNIKNPDSQIFQCVCCLKAMARFSLSGTPIENSPLELWAHYHFLLPTLFQSRQEFMEKSVDVHWARGKVAPFFLKRKKSEVAQELPAKIIQDTWLSMHSCQKEYYDAFHDHLRQKLQGEKIKMVILEGILRLRQLCCHPRLIEENTNIQSMKLDQLYADVSEILAAGQKVIIYSQFTSMLEMIREHLQSLTQKIDMLTGKTKDREKVVKAFQETNDVQVFLISLKAGGVGLNLNEADYVIIYEPWWNESVENQAIDRAHRIGRTDTLVVKRYLLTESIEEKIFALKNKKQAIADQILEGEYLANYSLEELQDILIQK